MADSIPNQPPPLDLGRVIQFIRSSRNISCRALSSMSGLSPSYVGKVESGSLGPSFDAFCSISAALQMTDNEMLFLIKLNQRNISENIGKHDKNVDGVPLTGEVQNNRGQATEA